MDRMNRIKDIAKTIPNLYGKTEYCNERTLDEIWDYLVEFDLSDLKEKICIRDRLFPFPWCHSDAEDAINQYKMYIFLCRKYISEYSVIPPSFEIDEIWHHHILDTKSYHKMCDFVFGSYFHHYPYFGMRGDSDKENLRYTFNITIDLFKKEFNCPIYRFRDYDKHLEMSSE